MSFNRFVLLERYPPMRHYTQRFIYVFFLVECTSSKRVRTTMRVYFSINRTQCVVTMFYLDSEPQAGSNVRLERTECEIKKKNNIFYDNGHLNY